MQQFGETPVARVSEGSYVQGNPFTQAHLLIQLASSRAHASMPCTKDYGDIMREDC